VNRREKEQDSNDKNLVGVLSDLENSSDKVKWQFGEMETKEQNMGAGPDFKSW
jgi:hypothetical protein